MQYDENAEAIQYDENAEAIKYDANGFLSGNGFFYEPTHNCLVRYRTAFWGRVWWFCTVIADVLYEGDVFLDDENILRRSGYDGNIYYDGWNYFYGRTKNGSILKIPISMFTPFIIKEVN